MKVMLNTLKPLRRVQHIRNSKGEVVVIEIKYERLPNFCYASGILGHIECDCCNVAKAGRGEDKQWGSWLRASPRKGKLKLQEEANVVLRGVRALYFEVQRDVSAIEVEVNDGVVVESIVG